MTPSKRRKGSVVALVSLVALAASSLFCGGPKDETVSAHVAVIDHTKTEFSAAFVIAVAGTYGSACSGRAPAGTDTWTVSIWGGPAADELSVHTNDSSCVLTLTNVVTTEGTFLAVPAIPLDAADAYAASASTFSKSGGPLLFYANAKISALTFATDFTISLLLSGDPTASDGGTRVAKLAAPALRSTKSFAVIAGQTVTNSGSGTSIVGDLGVSPGTSVTGMPAGQPSGATYLGSDAVAVRAQADLATLYDDLGGRACPTANVLSGQDLAGKTLLPGVYCFGSSAALGPGDLTLDANGDPDAYWVFQIGSTLDVASSTVTVIHGGSACNVFWQVGSSATVLDDARFAGNIVAFASITLDTGASVSPGRALARNGAVTMLTNLVSTASCP